MKIPGSDILNMALGAINAEKPKLSRVILPLPAPDASGIVTPSYYARVAIKASFQPVPRAQYEALGLDLQKNWAYCYTSEPLQDLERNAACDMLDYGGRRYNVTSNEPWNKQDGWGASLCVDIGPSP